MESVEVEIEVVVLAGEPEPQIAPTTKRPCRGRRMVAHQASWVLFLLCARSMKWHQQVLTPSKKSDRTTAAQGKKAIRDRARTVHGGNIPDHVFRPFTERRDLRALRARSLTRLTTLVVQRAPICGTMMDDDNRLAVPA